MEELTPEELEEVMRVPQPKTRKSKRFARDHRTWFYVIQKSLGTCDNTGCKDPRKKKLVHVWTNPDGINMCRYCFLDGWLSEELAA